jgi:hypothetical protein
MKPGTYSYNELTPELKEEARDLYRDSISYEDTIDWNYETATISNDLEEEFGLSDVEIKFSGFYSQGDGASFTGLVTEMSKFLGKIDPGVKELLERSGSMSKFDEAVTIRFVRASDRYLHENTCQAEIDFDEWNYPELFTKERKEVPNSRNSTFSYEEYWFLPFGVAFEYYSGGALRVSISDLDKKVEEWRKKECGIIYRKLERIYDDSRSDESLEEHMEANEAEFEVDEVRGELKVTAIL